MNHKQCNEDKTMLAYGKYLRGEYFEKVRAVIIKDDKIAFIKDLKTNKVTIPGGGVDQGESIEQACKREALAESGFEVNPIMPVASNEYEIKLNIGSIDFVSKRIEYFYICEFVKNTKKADLGLDGEYEGNVEVFFDSVDKLSQYYKIDQNTIEQVKKYIENK